MAPYYSRKVPDSIARQTDAEVVVMATSVSCGECSTPTSLIPARVICTSTPQSRASNPASPWRVQSTWEEQERYIREDKIGKYPNHYYARYDGGKIAEIWKLDCHTVLGILMPKIEKQYPKKKEGKQKDPRIGVTVSTKEIKKYGTRVL